MNKNNTKVQFQAGPPKRKVNFNVLLRIIKLLFKSYPVLLPIVIVCIVSSAVVSAIPAVFTQKFMAIVTGSIENGQMSWDVAKNEILPLIAVLITLYVISLLFVTIQTQLMAYITQGFLGKMRRKMFEGMQNLPIKYFDTHKHGDIMSYYTNDIDTLRQLISQSLTSLLQASIIVLTVLFVMLYYSVLMTGIILMGVVLMFLVSKKFGGGSAKYFIRQQKSIGRTEGYVQEMMNGQKVIKVFGHEKTAKEEFEKINDELCRDSFKANAFANILGPVIMNIGNVLYVVCITVGGLFLVTNCPNISISGLPFTIDIVIPFLNMTKQFTGNVNQVSQQINSIVMAMAGAERVFSLMDEQKETELRIPVRLPHEPSCGGARL